MSATRRANKQWRERLEDVEAPKRCTDLGNARRLVERFGEDLIYTQQHGWLVWDGRRWQRDETGEVQRLAQRSARMILDEARDAATPEERDRLVQHQRKSESAQGLRQCLEVARSQPEIAKRASELDRDPWLLTCTNGTVDLRTGVLREHRRQDLITKIAGCAYDAAARAPTFDRFLEHVQPDPLVRAYLQRWAGYTLTGDTSEQAFLFLLGPGANGKSTYLEAMRNAMGDGYARTTGFSTLTVHRNDEAPRNDLAALVGARLVTAAEGAEGAKLDAALLKRVTGGDTISVRPLYKEAIEYRPEFKLLVATNHRPRISDPTSSIWRRVHFVPFPVEIPKPEIDKELPRKLCAELPGILRWMVEGCLAWQRDGLDQPKTLADQVDEYRADEDLVGPFLADTDEVKVVADAEVKASQLYAAYVAWCETARERPLSQRAFGERVVARGIRRVTSNGRKYQGIALVKPPPKPEEEDHRAGRENGRLEGSDPISGNSLSRTRIEKFPQRGGNPSTLPLRSNGEAHREAGSDG